MATNTPDKMTGAIQAGRRKLFGSDEETYRAFLRAVTGKDSLRAMSGKEKFAVLQQMKADGFSMPGAGAAASSVNAGETAAYPGGQPNAQMGLIRHIWLELHRAGHVQSDSWESMEKYCTRITRAPLARCASAQLSLVIETLKKWARRVDVALNLSGEAPALR